MSKKIEQQKEKVDSRQSLDSVKRRKLLGAIAAGGAAANLLPTKWSKPVVDSVLLPAHAEMSPTAVTSVSVGTTGQISTIATIPTVALSTFSCTATGYLIGASSASGFITSWSGTSYSGNHSSTAASYTYAVVTGSVSSSLYYTGTGRGYYTVPGGVTGSYFVPYIFDTTCAG